MTDTAALIEQIKNGIDMRLNDVLCEMKPNYDDSITGFNEAWDVVRKYFKDRTPSLVAEALSRLTAPPPEKATEVALLSEIIDHFAANGWRPGDNWAFPDDNSSLCLDCRLPDRTKFWLDIERTGVVIFWKQSDGKARTLRLSNFTAPPPDEITGLITECADGLAAALKKCEAERDFHLGCARQAERSRDAIRAKTFEECVAIVELDGDYLTEQASRIVTAIRALAHKDEAKTR